MTTSWRSDSLVVRYARRADLPEIAAILSDEVVCRWLWFGPLDFAGAEAYFGPILDAQAAALAEGRHAPVVEFVVHDARTGGFIGHAACVAVEGSPGGYEIGFALGREHHRRGHGTRIGRFLVAFALRILGARRIEAACLAGNEASARLLERSGLRPEGTKRGYRVMRGERHDERIFGVRMEDLDGDECDRWAEEWGLAPRL